MTFQECLNSYIKELGCSGKELAANSGISETVISRYRKGERLPASDSEYLKKLADGIDEKADLREKALNRDAYRSDVHTRVIEVLLNQKEYK